MRKRKKMEDSPDVVSLATKLKNTVVQYYNTDDGEWRIAKKTKDATVWRKPSEEFSGYLYKTQGIVEDVANRIVDHIRPGPYRLHWDSLMTSMDIVNEFEEIIILCIGIEKA
ncbi:StAR-related lipid transfer protein 4, partial [Varanus komodoensis]